MLKIPKRGWYIFEDCHGNKQKAEIEVNRNGGFHFISPTIMLEQNVVKITPLIPYERKEFKVLKAQCCCCEFDTEVEDAYS